MLYRHCSSQCRWLTTNQLCAVKFRHADTEVENSLAGSKGCSSLKNITTDPWNPQQAWACVVNVLNTKGTQIVTLIHRESISCETNYVLTTEDIEIVTGIEGLNIFWWKLFYCQMYACAVVRRILITASHQQTVITHTHHPHHCLSPTDCHNTYTSSSSLPLTNSHNTYTSSSLPFTNRLSLHIHIIIITASHLLTVTTHAYHHHHCLSPTDCYNTCTS